MQKQQLLAPVLLSLKKFLGKDSSLQPTSLILAPSFVACPVQFLFFGAPSGSTRRHRSGHRSRAAARGSSQSELAGASPYSWLSQLRFSAAHCPPLDTRDRTGLFRRQHLTEAHPERWRNVPTHQRPLRRTARPPNLHPSRTRPPQSSTMRSSWATSPATGSQPRVTLCRWQGRATLPAWRSCLRRATTMRLTPTARG